MNTELNPSKLIARRMAGIEPSGIRKVSDLAASLSSPVNLSIGQPDFDVPGELIAECQRQMAAGRNSYTTTAGIAALREKLMAVAARKGIVADDVMVTCGTSGVLTLAMLALIEPGDDVLISDPFFTAYKQLVRLAGGNIVLYDTYPTFDSILEPIQRAITPRTKLVIINNPANPTGATIAAAELAKVVAFVESRGAMVIADEIYGAYSYDRPVQSMGAMGRCVLSVDGLSKSHSMTGWRLGWVYGPSAVIAEMVKLQQYTFINAPTMVQYAAIMALDYDVSAYIETYRQKRNRICDGLKQLGYEFTYPQGAFYVFPKAPWGSASEFAAAAIKHSLMVVPGNVFSTRDTHFRISYAVADATIDKSLEIFARLKNQGPAK